MAPRFAVVLCSREGVSGLRWQETRRIRRRKWCSCLGRHNVLTWPQRDVTQMALPGPKTLLATSNLHYPTLPPLTLPEASQYASPGPSHIPSLHQPRSQTTALPRIYPPPYPTAHPSPPAFGLPGHGHGRPMTPQSAHKASDAGYRFPPVVLEPETDGFEAELAFYLFGDESWGRVLGFL